MNYLCAHRGGFQYNYNNGGQCAKKQPIQMHGGVILTRTRTFAFECIGA